jgi:hypothetical protein
MLKEYLIYGVKDQEPDYMESLLVVKSEPFKSKFIDQFKIQAKKDGFIKFRVTSNNLSEKPDFINAITK